MTALHEIPVRLGFFRAIVAGNLRFLLAEAGRYALHDVVRLDEVDPDTAVKTGAYCYVQVTFIVGDPSLGLRNGFVALSIKVKILSERIDTDALLGKKD